MQNLLLYVYWSDKANVTTKLETLTATSLA